MQQYILDFTLKYQSFGTFLIYMVFFIPKYLDEAASNLKLSIIWRYWTTFFKAYFQSTCQIFCNCKQTAVFITKLELLISVVLLLLTDKKVNKQAHLVKNTYWQILAWLRKRSLQTLPVRNSSRPHHQHFSSYSVL